MSKYDWLDTILKTQQEYVQQCTLANIQAAKTTGQWVIHDPNRESAKSLIIKKIEERERALLEDLLIEAIDMEYYEAVPLIKERMKK